MGIQQREGRGGEGRGGEGRGGEGMRRENKRKGKTANNVSHVHILKDNSTTNQLTFHQQTTA